MKVLRFDLVNGRMVKNDLGNYCHYTDYDALAGEISKAKASTPTYITHHFLDCESHDILWERIRFLSSEVERLGGQDAPNASVVHGISRSEQVVASNERAVKERSPEDRITYILDNEVRVVWDADGWYAVHHARTGNRLGKGRTRNEAIDDAIEKWGG